MTAAAQLLRCPACGAVNRVPVDKLQHGDDPVCGRCKTPLPVKQPVTVTDASFETEVEKSTLPVLVDLWAPWCGPCRMVAPILYQIAAEQVGRVRVAKLDIDQNPATTSRFGVQSIPLLLIFNQGQEVDRILGAVPKTEIMRYLEPLLAPAP